MFVFAAAPALSARFALIIDGLCRLVAARGARQRASGALVVLIWTRLRRMAARFARLAADPAAALRERPPPDAARPPRLPPAMPRLPRGFAWLVRALPEAACFGEQLRHLMAEPEMAPLLAIPRMARLLDPLCRMLAVEPPDTTQPPARSRGVPPTMPGLARPGARRWPQASPTSRSACLCRRDTTRFRTAITFRIQNEKSLCVVPTHAPGIRPGGFPRHPDPNGR